MWDWTQAHLALTALHLYLCGSGFDVWPATYAMYDQWPMPGDRAPVFKWCVYGSMSYFTHSCILPLMKLTLKNKWSDFIITFICFLSNRAEPGSCEERDPFLPGRGSRGGTLTSLGGPGYSRPRHSHTPPQTPPFPGTLWVLFFLIKLASLGITGIPTFR